MILPVSRGAREVNSLLFTPHILLVKYYLLIELFEVKYVGHLPVGLARELRDARRAVEKWLPFCETFQHFMDYTEELDNMSLKHDISSYISTGIYDVIYTNTTIEVVARALGIWLVDDYLPLTFELPPIYSKKNLYDIAEFVVMNPQSVSMSWKAGLPLKTQHTLTRLIYNIIQLRRGEADQP
jgi:hypothetical protein